MQESTKKKTLTDIAIRKESILAEIVSHEGELTPELESELLSVTFEEQSKIEAYVYIMKKLEHEAEFWKKERESISLIEKRLLNAHERMKKRLKEHMIHTNLDEISGVTTRLTLSPMKPQVVIPELTPEEALPQFIRTKVTKEFDKDKIREAIQRGITLDWAHLVPSYSLRITKQARLENHDKDSE